MKRDRPRPRAIDEEGRSSLDEKRQYLDYPHIHQREVIASPLAPSSRIHLPAAAPSYDYDRTLEIDAYRHSVLVDHHDSYRLPVSESQDTYRQESYIQPHESWDAYRREWYIQPRMESRDAYRKPQFEHHDVYRPVHRDSYRRELLLELNDVHRPIRRDSDRRDVELEVWHRDEIAGDDPYILYRKRHSYHDPAYIDHVSPERDRCHISPERDRYHPRGLTSKYQSREALLAEYHSSRARY